MRPRTVLMLVFFAFAALAGCSGGTPCGANSDCVNSQEAKDVGRCFPIEAYCQRGTCTAACRGICASANAAVNSCENQALVCNDAVSAPETAFCTALPIACASVDNCPLYRPADAQGIQHDWTCDAGTCRYPGLRYLVEMGG